MVEDVQQTLEPMPPIIGSPTPESMLRINNQVSADQKLKQRYTETDVKVQGKRASGVPT